jgi:hypothetical protein
MYIESEMTERVGKVMRERKIREIAPPSLLVEIQQEPSEKKNVYK